MRNAAGKTRRGPHWHYPHSCFVYIENACRGSKPTVLCDGADPAGKTPLELATARRKHRARKVPHGVRRFRSVSQRGEVLTGKYTARTSCSPRTAVVMARPRPGRAGRASIGGRRDAGRPAAPPGRARRTGEPALLNLQCHERLNVRVLVSMVYSYTVHAIILTKSVTFKTDPTIMCTTRKITVHSSTRVVLLCEILQCVLSQIVVRTVIEYRVKSKDAS
jgi:hypothetical protein